MYSGCLTRDIGLGGLGFRWVGGGGFRVKDIIRRTSTLKSVFLRSKLRGKAVTSRGFDYEVHFTSGRVICKYLTYDRVFFESKADG